jgi:ABC-type polysaccharide/polyol phosphate transport system ATPase subunit
MDYVCTAGPGNLLEVENLGLCFRSIVRTTLKRQLIQRVIGLTKGNGTGATEPDERFWALKDVSFTLKKGESLGIIGANGAGKTTLLKLLAGIYPPTTGSVKYGGSILLLLQLGLGFHAEFTGAENVFLAMAFLGVGGKQVRPMLDHIFEFSGLQDFRDVPLKKYSQGMVGRLAFTISLSVDSDILVLDEVFSAGDMHWTAKGLARLEERMASSKGLIIVSHTMAQVRAYCNKVILLHKGSVVRFGGLEVVDEYEQGIHL